MKNYLEKKLAAAEWKLLQAKCRIKEGVDTFLHDEKGDTNFVSIMLIIVIVIALAVLFKDTLTQLAQNVLGQLTDFVGG